MALTINCFIKIGHFVIEDILHAPPNPINLLRCYPGFWIGIDFSLGRDNCI